MMSGETKSRHSAFANVSDLFSYDKDTLAGEILLPLGKSSFEFHEYASYSAPDELPPALKDKLRPGDPVHITHKRPVEEADPAREAFHKAFHEGYGLDITGNFTKMPSTDPVLEGRVREVVCFRRINLKSQDGNLDGLTLTPEEFDAMDLHPATLQYVRRITTESSFWDRSREKLSLILSFSANPTTPFDFLSMTYNLKSRVTNALIRQSYNPRQHGISDLDEYDQRLEACRTHWSHPFVLPVVLLQVQFARTEEAVAANNKEVLMLERAVAGMAGFDPSEMRMARRTSTMKSEKEALTGPAAHWGVQVYQNTTTLMKVAHDTLRNSIKLLDTMKWMERAFSLLLERGNEMENIIRCRNLVAPGAKDPLNDHWHEIREYLDGLLRLCMSLETDRRMSENRCRAQIDIIYAKMAQEDNNLNARMAVATTRDSSSMKALAVITALFLPAEFLGTMFGMSFFEFLPDDDDSSNVGNSNSTSASAASALVKKQEGSHVLSPLFWVYWAAAIPLTLVILVAWRAWWVSQDRYFRQHLSPELSQERYWTADGQPRSLATSFFRDFFLLSSHKDEKASDESAASTSDSSGKNRYSVSFKKYPGVSSSNSRTTTLQKLDANGIDEYYPAPLDTVHSVPVNIRLREIAGARKSGKSLLP